MTPRRVQVGMTVVLGLAAVLLVVLDRPVLAILIGIAALAQLLAAFVAPRGRILATIVFVDVVESTRILAGIGDAAWSETFDRFSAATQRQLHRIPATLIKDLGDGFVAAVPLVVSGPGRVIDAARGISRDARAQGLETRIGIHVGECALTRRDVRGLAVHTAARLMDAAEPGQILVSSAVRELVAGTDVGLVDAGERELKGLDGPVRLFAVAK